MAQTLTKGTLFKFTISSVLTTIAQLMAVTPPGWKSESWESTTFDQSGVGKSKDMTGYAEGNEFSCTLFWDPALASHAAILASITTPVKTAAEVLFPSTKKIDFTIADLELSPKVERDKAAMAELKAGIDGLPVVS
jgi:hypothetical protein